MKDKLRFFWFLLIPSIIFLITLPLQEANGPYYYSKNGDPAYLYLLNSLKIATFRTVHHLDNPGTTVQVAGGAIIKTLASAKGVNDIEKEVFENPEYYLKATNRFLLSINILAIFILGISAYVLTGNLWMSLLIQCAPFASWRPFEAMLKVSPEPMLVFACTGFIILIVWAAEKQAHLKKPRLFTFLLAMVTAFGLASKLTFLPLMFAALILLPGIKWKGIYLALTAALFHVFIIPAIPHYDYLIRWITRLTLHNRQYGMGEPAFLDPNYAFDNLIQLIALDHTLYIAVFISAILLTFVFTNKKIRNVASRNPLVKILLGITVAIIFHLLLVAKHFHPHYMIPSLMLFTTLIYLNINLCKLIADQYPSIHLSLTGMRIKTIVLILVAGLLFIRHFISYLPDTSPEYWIKQIVLPNSVFLIGFILLLAIFIVAMRYLRAGEKRTNLLLNYFLIALFTFYQIRHIDLDGFHDRLKNSKQEAESLIGLMENEFKGAVRIYGEKSSSVTFALKSGAHSNFRQAQYLEKMKAIYPDKKIFFWGLDDIPRIFESWIGPVELSEIMEYDSIAVLSGDNRNLTPENVQEIELTNRVEFENVFAGEFEQLYVIRKKVRSGKE